MSAKGPSGSFRGCNRESPCLAQNVVSNVVVVTIKFWIVPKASSSAARISSSVPLKRSIARSSTLSAIVARRSAISASSGSRASRPLSSTNDISYSRLIAALKKAQVRLDRKVLSDIAIVDPKAFTAIVDQVRSLAPAH